MARPTADGCVISFRFDLLNAWSEGVDATRAESICSLGAASRGGARGGTRQLGMPFMPPERSEGAVRGRLFEIRGRRAARQPPLG